MKIANFLNKFSKDDSLNHIVQKLCESAITITKGIHNDDYEIEQTTKNIDIIFQNISSISITEY